MKRHARIHILGGPRQFRGMPGYQDHLLFGATLTLPAGYVLGPHLSLDGAAVVVSTAFILLAAVFPDVDHRNAVVHRRLKALTVLIGAGAAAVWAWPDIVLAGVAAVAAGAVVTLLFGTLKPRHRTVTHTYRAAVVFALAVGLVSFRFFGSFVPAIFAFLAYLSHLILDGTIGD